MKMTQELKDVTANLQPGVITAAGFLGTDDRPLPQIIEHDEELFRQLGLDWNEVAKKLRYLLDAGSAGLGEPTVIDGQWLIRVDETRGKLPSPWQDGLFRKLTAEVERLVNGNPTGNKIIYNELCLHLLETHHFLQGRGGAFRLEPEILKKVLM